MVEIPDGFEFRTTQQLKSAIDAGRRRHLSWTNDFDTRSTLLTLEIGEQWEEDVKQIHRRNKEKIKQELMEEFGEHGSEMKMKNFSDIGVKPFSIVAYHNRLFHEVRQSFVIGAYYPALVGACALGERILNHLVLDLRSFFSSTPEYKKVYRKNSFDDWRLPIETLEAWGVLLPEAAAEFHHLMPLRHRSIHFNIDSYRTMREDALTAISHVRSIIELQFGTFATRPWFIPGTVGHVFIKKEYETHPFVSTYFIPRCPFVGPLFGMAYNDGGWTFVDEGNYGVGEWTDEEFAQEYNNRQSDQVVRFPQDPSTKLATS